MFRPPKGSGKKKLAAVAGESEPSTPPVPVGASKQSRDLQASYTMHNLDVSGAIVLRESTKAVQELALYQEQ